MARIKTRIGSSKGKSRDDVFVASRTYGEHHRSAPSEGSKKDEAALKKQYKRTRYLNKLASEINTIIGDNAPIKHSFFYQQVQSRFREEPSNNRFLLLMQLKTMEVNPDYQLSKTGSCTLNVARGTKDMVVTLRILGHPSELPHKDANTYSYEVLLVYWNKSNKRTGVAKQYSEWMTWDFERPRYFNLPVYDFTFPIPKSTTHWLVAVRRTFGNGGKELGLKATDGMQIMEVGTWDKKEAALLAKKNKQVSQLIVPDAAEPVRVKPRPIDETNLPGA
jgi:hypothetical protein